STLEILGATKVTLNLSVNRPTAFVCVRLNDVKLDGSSTRVAYAVMNLTHRNGHHRAQKLIPGRQYRVNIQLSDAAYSFIRGHRLRVAISTTYWPMIWPSPETVELTLHTRNSSIELPVRPSRGGPKLKPFLAAEEGPPMPATVLSAGASGNTVSRDVLSGRVEVLSERGGDKAVIDEHGLEVGGRKTIERMSITEGDPLSAETEMTVGNQVKRDGFDVEVFARTHLTSTKDEFFLIADLDVYESKDRVLAKRWSVAFPRRGI
nr:peptidase S15 [Gammaproteobacteria bacterium]